MRPEVTLPSLSRYISHDVTTALRFARLNLKNLERALESGSREAVHDQIESLRTRLDGAELILDRVRDFGATVDIDVTPVPVDLPVLAEELGRIVDDRGFAFEWNGPALRTITARDPLRLVLGELLRNAVDHHDEPTGTVRVAWTDEAGRIGFQVSDDGPGIPDEKRGALFRFGGTIGPRDVRRHAGVGLAIVAHLSSLLEQELVIAPNPRGSRGTTVRLTWPMRWPARPPGNDAS